MDVNSDRLWEREALRLCDRYVNEVVLAFDLCPWAEPSLRAGRVARGVCLSVAPTPAECLPFVDGMAAPAADGTYPDIGLLTFPRHAAGWAAFDGFAERVRRAMAEQRQPPGSPSAIAPRTGTFLVAAFHPDGAETFVGPHQLVSFLRRTPDPTLQFVRAEIIDRVKANQPDASEAVAVRNHDNLRGAGALRLQAVIAAIRADREMSYARLAVPGLT